MLALGCRADTAVSRGRNLLAEVHDAELRAEAFDLIFLAARQDVQAAGWLAPEDAAAPASLWMRRGSASLELPFLTGAEKELLLRLRCDPSRSPLPVAVSLDDQPLATVQVTVEERSFRLAVPARAAAAGPATLRFAVADTGPARGPLDDVGGAVRRSLALTGLEVRPAGEAGRIAPPLVQENGFWLQPRAAVAFFVRSEAVPEVSLALEAAAALGARAEVTWNAGERPQALATLTTDAGETRRMRQLLSPGGGFGRLEIVNLGPGRLRLREARVRDLRTSVESPTPGQASARLPRRPNLVVFLVDTLRADRLGAYGHARPTSPHFDAFAREATLYEDAWAQAPWTRPSVASIFTGLHVGSHGMGGLNRVLVPQLTTLAEAFRAAGYRTGGFVANHVVNGRFGFDQGFDSWNEGQPTLYGASAGALVERALRWAEAGPGPFLLYVHTLEPHSPYEPPEADWAPFRDPGYRGVRDSRTLLLRETQTEDELRYLHSRYEGEIRANDRAFGALVEGLRARGWLDDSILVFTADHGEEFREHGGMEHAYTVYQELLHIPLAVRLPGALHAGRRDAAPVQQIDLFPTLAALAGVAVRSATEGRDLSARWMGAVPAAADRELEQMAELRFGDVEKLAFRAGDLKLVQNDDARRFWRAGAKLELYDLARDPGERRNLAAERPLATRYLLSRATALSRIHTAVRRRHKAGAQIELNQDDQEQLRALGYIR